VVAAGAWALAGCADSSGVAEPAASAGGGGAPAIVPGSLLAPQLGCPAGTGVLVLDRVAVQLQNPYTVVVARCDSGAGSPPSGVYVVQAEPLRVVATLVRPTQDLEVSALTASRDGGGAASSVQTVQVAATGYSNADVPRCCPDTKVTLTWQALGDQLVPVP
jgi:hypothetical protein